MEEEEVEGRVVCGRTAAAAAAPVAEVRASCEDEDEDEDEDGEVKGPHVAQLPRFFISVSQLVSRARRAVSRRSRSASRCSVSRSFCSVARRRACSLLVAARASISIDCSF